MSVSVCGGERAPQLVLVVVVIGVIGGGGVCGGGGVPFSSDLQVCAVCNLDGREVTIPWQPRSAVQDSWRVSPRNETLEMG